MFTPYSYVLLATLLISNPEIPQDSGFLGTISRARALQEMGNFEKSRAILEEQNKLCESTPRTKPECVMLLYSLGFLHYNWPAGKEEETLDSISEAEKNFLRARELQFDHWPSFNGLVHSLVRKITLTDPENHQRDIDLLESLVKDLQRFPNPEERALLAVTLGDALNEVGSSEDFSAYLQAVKALPERLTPRRRLVEAIDKGLKAESLEELLRYLETWDEDAPNIAGKGYSRVVQSFWKKDPLVAEGILINWIRLGQEMGWLKGEEALSWLPESWDSPVLQDVRTIMKGKGLKSIDPKWAENQEYSDALAAVLNASGKYYSQRGMLQATSRVWMTVFDLPMLAKSESWADLYLEMAVFFHNQLGSLPKAPVFLAKTVSLVDSILQSKLEAPLFTSKHHGILGLILTDLPTDSKNLHRAISHLNMALRERDDAAQGPKSPPQPQLWLALADNYAALEDHDDRFHALLGATRAYLDRDNLFEAGEVLEFAQGLYDQFEDQGVSSTDRLMYEDLDFLVQAREENFREGQAPFCGTHQIGSLLNDSNISSPFFLRQQFKFSADCLRKLGDNSPKEVARKTLSFYMDNDFALSSPEDVVRVQHLFQVVSQNPILKIEFSESDHPSNDLLARSIALDSPGWKGKYTYVHADANTLLSLGFKKPEREEERVSSDRGKNVVPAGTRLRVRLTKEIDPSLRGSRVEFIAVLEQDLTIEGRVLIQKNTRFSGSASISPGGRDSPLIYGLDPSEERFGDESWELELTKIMLGEKYHPLSTGQFSFVSMLQSGSRNFGRDSPQIERNTLIDFWLSSPIHLPLQPLRWY